MKLNASRREYELENYVTTGKFDRVNLVCQETTGKFLVEDKEMIIDMTWCIILTMSNHVSFI